MSKNISLAKDVYREFCEKQGFDLPVFFQDWWLDIVCGKDDWRIAMYVEDPNVVAVMTYYVKRKFFFEYITMPSLTKFMGPYFLKNFDHRKAQSVLAKLIDTLPAVSGFSQTLHYQINNWLPYKWRGYKQTAYYSYTIDNIQKVEQVWQNLDADYRNNKIARAEKIYSVGEDLDFDTLYQLTLQPFERQKVAIPISRSVLSELVTACERKKSGKSLFASDGDGKIVAVVYLVWDRKSCYLLLAGENEQSRLHGAGIYLTWQAIKYASENLGVKTFDFLGGMSENLERTRRQFGASQTPYFLISKFAGLLKLKDIFS